MSKVGRPISVALHRRTVSDAFRGTSTELICSYPSWRLETGEQEGRILANALRKYTWHQQLRRSVGAPGALLLTLAPHSFRTSKSYIARLARRYFLVISSFITSGIVHASGSWATSRSQDLPLSDGGELWYFLL